jgi:two-component system chemotaxis response regulator CheY
MTTILTVDDSPTIRHMLQSTLSEAGFDVLQAEHGEQGLKLLQSNEVDLIISDVNMTVMGGFEFVTRVRDNPDYMGVPILFLTTEASDEFKQMGREIGATGWLEKPFDPEELLKVVRRVIA